MYKINFDKHIDLINWECIYWGIKEHLIEPDNAIIYANKVIDENSDAATPEIIELLIIDDISNDNVLPLIEKMFSDKTRLNKSKATAMRTLRYIILFEVKMNSNNNQILLDEIESIYTDFDYPSDMENFIAYMPVTDDEYDVSTHSAEENEQRLVNNFNLFMCNELKFLEKSK